MSSLRPSPLIRRSLVRAITKTLDLDGGLIEAVVSSEAKDRAGDIIRQEHWDLKNFKEHPVLLSSHDYLSLRSVIGEWESMKVKDKQLIGVAKYYIGQGNEEADWGFNLASRGRAAYSVGFLPNMAKAKELESDSLFGSFEFNGQELLEVSQVSIPANPEALQHMKGLRLDPIISDLISEQLKELANPHIAGTLTQAEVMDAIAQAVMKRLTPYLKHDQMAEMMSMMEDMKDMLAGMMGEKTIKTTFQTADLAEAIKHGMKGV